MMNFKEKMSLDIPPGYKKTEIGIIPEDWEVKRLGDIVLPNGLIRGPFGSSLKKEFFVKRGYKVFTQENAIYQNIELGNYYIDENKFRALKRFRVKTGDYILSCSGTIGKIFRIPKKHPKGIINQALLIIRIDESIIVNDYFHYYFIWDKFQEKIIDNSHGGAMQNLVSIEKFKDTALSLPPLPEQRAIARILSDIDKLIESIDKLIEKKKLIKKGAMQQLLTGKKRLPGFKGKWVRKRLGKVADIKKGDLITEKEAKKGNIPVIGGGIGPTYYHNKPNRKPNTITISASGANAGYVDFHEYPIFASDCSTIEESDFYNIKFLYYLLKSKQSTITQLQTGGAQPHVYPEQLKKLTITLPPTPAEQKAIAQILSDMDAEIEALERKKKKYEMIKKGKMELLLTGKLRVKEENDEIKKLEK